MSSKEVGRPTKYKPEYCKLLEEHLKQGLSFETFAAVIDVNPDTIYRWSREISEFSEAKKRGYAHSRLFWEKMGIKGTLGEISNFNSGTWCFNMKNRFKWRDRTELSGDNKAPFEFKGYDPSKRIRDQKPE